MGTIRTRKGKDGSVTYYAEVRRKGYAPAYDAFERLTDAKRWIQDTESNMRGGRYSNQVEAKKKTLSDAIDRYVREELPKKPKSYDQQLRQLNWFKEKLGYRYLIDVSPAVISEVKGKFLTEDARGGEPRKPQTWNRYHAIISCVLQMCCGEWQWVEYNAARRVKREKEGKGRVRFLSDDERDKLLAACKVSRCKHLYPSVVLALATGMRSAEVRYLTWNDIDLSKGVIILRDTKNKETRRVSLRGFALEIMREHAKVRQLGTPWIFPGEFSAKTGKPVTLREAWIEAREAAGIPEFRFHDLRHSCASYLAMNGASLLEIAEVLGHKTLVMVKRYSHLAETHTAGVVERMNNKIFG